MICQFIQESLFALNQYDTLHQRNSQKYFISESKSSSKALLFLKNVI
nr:MAG TPA: hypothetical protein [Crassvirales sp.]